MLWWALSSFGRAPLLHSGGEEFESPRVHQSIPEHSGGVGFESPSVHQSTNPAFKSWVC